MQKFNFSYIEKLKKAFSEHNITFYDFTTPETIITTSDCEFIDGFHGGDVLYTKILRKLSETEPLLNKYINHAYLENIVTRYNGLAMMPNKSICPDKEIDFLKIGCSKSFKD